MALLGFFILPPFVMTRLENADYDPTGSTVNCMARGIVSRGAGHFPAI